MYTYTHAHARTHRHAHASRTRARTYTNLEGEATRLNKLNREDHSVWEHCTNGTQIYLVVYHRIQIQPQK